MDSEKPKPAEYREGDEEKTLPEQEEPSKEELPKAITAFIVLKHADGRNDVITEIGGFPMQRPVTPQEICEMCSAIAAQFDRAITGQIVAAQFARTMTQAAAQAQIGQIQAQMGNPGVPRVGKR